MTDLPTLAECQDWVQNAEQITLGQFSRRLEELSAIARHELACRAWRQDPRVYRSAAYRGVTP